MRRRDDRTTYRKSKLIWGHSSDGRAPALHAGGRRFDPAWLHQLRKNAVAKEQAFDQSPSVFALKPAREELPKPGIAL